MTMTTNNNRVDGCYCGPNLRPYTLDWVLDQTPLTGY